MQPRAHGRQDLPAARQSRPFECPQNVLLVVAARREHDDFGGVVTNLFGRRRPGLPARVAETGVAARVAVGGARMAVEDFGAAKKGMKVEIVSAETSPPAMARRVEAPSLRTKGHSGDGHVTVIRVPPADG